MKKIAISTAIGLVAGVGCILWAMYEASEGHIVMFYNLPSFLIIIGGTIACLIVSFPTESIKTMPSVVMIAFRKNAFHDLLSDVERLMECAYLVRREGILALENILEQFDDDPFLKRGLSLLVDGVDGDTFELFLQTDIIQAKQRHNTGCEMVSMIAATAPSLGLVGTYAGLIPMLNSLDDPIALGPLMALELISSFYGAFLAYLILAPLAKRLRFIAAAEHSRNILILEGLLNIRDGRNPKLIQENLMAFVSRIDSKKNKRRGKNQSIVADFLPRRVEPAESPFVAGRFD